MSTMNDVDAIDSVVKRATRLKPSARCKAEVLEACRHHPIHRAQTGGARLLRCDAEQPAKESGTGLGSSSFDLELQLAVVLDQHRA